MAARAYWQGQIRLALVSIPVEIYSASQSGAKISFRQIHEPSGKRISYEKVVEGVGPVDRDEFGEGPPMSEAWLLLVQADLLLSGVALGTAAAAADERHGDLVAHLPAADALAEIAMTDGTIVGEQDLTVGDRVLVETDSGPREAVVAIAPAQVLYSDLRGKLAPVLRKVDAEK